MYIVYVLHLSVSIEDIFRFFWFHVASLSSYYPSMSTCPFICIYFQSLIYSNVQLGEFLHVHTPIRQDHCPSWSYIILWSLWVHNLPISTNWSRLFPYSKHLGCFHPFFLINDAAVNCLLHVHASASDCFLWIHFWKLWNTGSEGMNIWKHSECLLVKHLSGSSCPEWLFSTLGFLLCFSWRVQSEYCINVPPPPTPFQCLASKVDPQEQALFIFVSPCLDTR